MMAIIVRRPFTYPPASFSNFRAGSKKMPPTNSKRYTMKKE
jgi:hypothetical protein